MQINVFFIFHVKETEVSVISYRLYPHTPSSVAGANAAVIAACKEKLLKAEKNLKVLDAKDAADKVLALEAVAKLIKKKKGGKKMKKSA